MVEHRSPAATVPVTLSGLPQPSARIQHSNTAAAPRTPILSCMRAFSGWSAVAARAPPTAPPAASPQKCAHRSTRWPPVPSMPRIASPAASGTQARRPRSPMRRRRTTPSPQYAQRAEDRGGGSHRDVVEAVGPRVAEVPQRARAQHQGGPDPRAFGPADRGQEEHHGHRVGAHVGQIGVQGKGGDRAPQLAAEDQLGGGGAARDPRHQPVGPSLNEEERQQPRRHPHAGVEGRLAGPHLLFGRRGAGLALVVPEFGYRLLQVPRGNRQHPAVGGALQTRSQALRFQHQRPFLGPAQVRRPAYDDFPSRLHHGVLQRHLRA